MASSDNENYATKFVNVLDTIQDKPAAATEEEEEEEEEEAAAAAAAATTGEGGQEQGGERGEENMDEKWRYIPLLRAALRGDWDSAKRIFDQDEAAFTANITDYEETALHVSVSSARSIDFVKKLVDLMPAEALELPNI
ncbi:hypothetical protein LOK49_LG09G01103 [Camellia lanceoleosa]|uniref:Uncharacterized protein n=1 Tax=Camellia lanceoleosa TaxID=1840588 RepID=A0ACC0GHX1_9ERIC|nr:hypothetical protein LOK49_LG09G01103 [Camellia lanceoleosa]